MLLTDSFTLSQPQLIPSDSAQKPAIALALAIELLGAGCLALCYDGLVAALAVGLVSHHGKSGSSCPQPSAQYSALE